MEFLKPFDFERIIIDYFLGGYTLFAFAFIIFMSSICAYFRMSTRLFMILLLVGGFIFSFILDPAIYIFLLMLFGFFVFKSLSKMFN
jgi:hypothetical protein